MENVITLGKLIGLLILFRLPSLFSFFANSKNTKNELARPVRGTNHFSIVCQLVYYCLWETLTNYGMRNYVFQTGACSKSVLVV